MSFWNLLATPWRKSGRFLRRVEGSAFAAKKSGGNHRKRFGRSTAFELLENRIALDNAASSALIGLTAMRSDPTYADIDGAGSTLVVIDTSFNTDHEAFGDGARIVHTRDLFDGDFDVRGLDNHGTRSASIIGSESPQFLGVAPGTDLVLLKFSNDTASQKVNFEDAVQYVIDIVKNPGSFGVTKPITAINISVGSDGLHNHDSFWAPEFSANLFAELRDLDVFVSVAAGNSFGPTCFDSAPGVDHPAADPNTFAVGAVYSSNVGLKDHSCGATTTDGRIDHVAAYSQRSRTTMQLLAPGGPIEGAPDSFGSYSGSSHGTSNAAPMVTGAIALLQQVARRDLGRSLNVNELQQILVNTGDLVKDGDDEQDNVTNAQLTFRRLDIYEAAKAVSALAGDPVNPTFSGTSANDTFILNGRDLAAASGNFELTGLRNLTIDVGQSGNDVVQVQLPITGPIDTLHIDGSGPGTKTLEITIDESYDYRIQSSGGVVRIEEHLPTPLVTVAHFQENVESVTDGLNEATDVVVSPSGRFAYVAGKHDQAIAIFQVGLNDEFEYVGRVKNGVDNVVDLLDPNRIVMTADGSRLYAISRSNGAIVYFDADTYTGDLTFAGSRTGLLRQPEGIVITADDNSLLVTDSLLNAVVNYDLLSNGAPVYRSAVVHNQGGASGLSDPRGLAIDEAGETVYVAAWNSDSIVTLARNPSNGSISFRSRIEDGGGINGLKGAIDVALSHDGRSAYVAGNLDDGIAVFSVSNDGNLQFVEFRKPGTNILEGPARLTVTPDDLQVIATGELSDTLVSFDRIGLAGTLQLAASVGTNDVGGPFENPQGVAVTPDGRYVLGAAATSDTLTALRRAKSLTIQAVDLDELSIVTGRGNDVIEIDLGDPEIAAYRVASPATTDGDVLFVHGTPDQETIDILGSTLRAMSATSYNPIELQFHNITNVDLDFDQSGNDTIFVEPDFGPITATIDSGIATIRQNTPDAIAEQLTLNFHQPLAFSLRGGDGDDQFFVAPASFTHINIDGDPDLLGDVLEVDAQGRSFSDDGSRVLVSGFKPVNYNNIETVNVIDGDDGPPTLISFTRNTPATNLTNADTLVFRARFSDGVVNVDPEDFVVTGTTAMITNVDQVDDRTYDLTLSDGDLPNFDGAVGIDLSDVQDIADTAGNPLPSSEPDTDETYILDNAAPQPVISSRVNSPTNVAPIPISVDFGEVVSAFEQGELTLANGTVTDFATADNRTFTFNLMPVGDGAITVDIAAGVASDTAGNSNLAANPFSIVSYRNAPPTLDVIPSPPPLLEDAGEQTINLSGITAGAGEVQALQVTATSNNTALIPQPTVNYASPGDSGSLIYTPVTDAYGTALITVTVTDGGLDDDLETAADNVSFARTFTVTVNPIDDAPSELTLSNATIAENTDTGSGPLTLGTLTGVDADQGATFTFSLAPGAGDDDNDSFEVVGNQLRIKQGIELNHEIADTYSLRIRVTDNEGLFLEQTFEIFVSDVNEAPTAIMLDKDSVDAQTAGAVVGGLSVTDPDAGDTHGFVVSGDDRFEVVNGQLKLKAGNSLNHEVEPTITLDVTATDAGSLSFTQSFAISVRDVNNPPVPGDDYRTMAEDTTLTITDVSLLANDFDEDGDPLSVVGFVANNVQGSIVFHSNNGSSTISFTPLENFFGSVTIGYKVSDGTEGDEVVGNIFVTILPVNDVPTAEDDNYSIAEDETLVMAAPGVLGNDSDAEDDPLTAVLVQDVQHGSLTFSGDGSFTYVPDGGFLGTDSFSYQANDGQLDSAPATVTIVVNATTIAAEDFESGGFLGGSGWSADWLVSGAATIVSSYQPHSGSYQLRLRDDNGYAQRTVDLSGHSDVHLQFWAKVRSFEGGEEAHVLVSPDGSDWTIVQTFANGDDDNLYHPYDIDLSSFPMTSQFFVAFEAAMSDSIDYLFIDDVTFVTTSPRLPTVSVGDATVVEGDSGTSNAAFTVSLGYESNDVVTVGYFTADATAVAPDDYLGISSGTITFAPGETSKTITVSVVGDSTHEPDEAFFVNLANPVNAVLGDGQAEGTILDDDAPPPQLLVISPPNPILEGDSGTTDAWFEIRLDQPTSQVVTVNYASGSGGFADPATEGVDYEDTSGTATFQPGQTSFFVTVPVIGDEGAEADEAFGLFLSNANGAVIFDGEGAAIIQDDDFSPPATRTFFVVDTWPAATFHYDENGTLLENFGLASNNDRPMGAAANAAGTKLWTINDDDQVYVYDAGGNLIGSWTAGSLVMPSGIATDSVDIWIVDGFRDKVYRYPGAADRIVGSQGPASSFDLASGNRSPAGITTDGTHLWIVDQSYKKVFQYTIAGALIGSWSIDSNQWRPTGITIDPSGASNDIWIVDSLRDQVFEYAGGKTYTSGAHSAQAVFDLAGDNSNPEGIADPPITSLSAPKSFRLPWSNIPTAALDLAIEVHSLSSPRESTQGLFTQSRREKPLHVPSETQPIRHRGDSGTEKQAYQPVVAGAGQRTSTRFGEQDNGSDFWTDLFDEMHLDFWQDDVSRSAADTIFNRLGGSR